MRVYVTESGLHSKTHPLDAMRPTTIQAVAMVNLMLQRWNEPSQPDRLHLSTLVQQILALIAQHGGLTARQGWNRLVESGVFRCVDQALYFDVLRRMGHPDVALIEQTSDGTLLPGAEGERVINDRGFYAVFVTPEEFSVVTDRGKKLGTIPVENPVMPEQLIIFAGHRWRVIEVDAARKEILVTAARGGKPPTFGGEGLPPAAEVVAEMRRIYEGIAVPRYLDDAAVQLLTEARDTFDHLGLRHSSVARHGDEIMLFPWAGEQAQMAFILALKARDIPATSQGISIVVKSQNEHELKSALQALATESAPDPVALARQVPDMKRAKYDMYLGDDLLARCYSSERIDAAKIPIMADDLLKRLPAN